MADKPIDSVPSGAMARGLRMAGLGLRLGARVALDRVNQVGMTEAHKKEHQREAFLAQTQQIVTEFGRLKGSVMKAGQMLSIFGEHFLPKEANDVLKTLQNQSTPVSFEAIEKILTGELGQVRRQTLEIDPKAIGTASIGQVHRARGPSGVDLALKVQYPGVRESIASDLKTLRRLLSMAKLVPRGPTLDPLFEEVEEMLVQETDYTQERVFTDRFRTQLADEPLYVVPKTFAAFSTQNILATSFEEGVALDGPEVRALSQSRRNGLGALALRLYFREFFELGRMQTDPHLGNYRVRIDPAGTEDKLVLLDFGATRLLHEDYVAGYRDLIRGSCNQVDAQILLGAKQLRLVREDDSPARKKAFCRLCVLICEGFSVQRTSDMDAALFEEGPHTYDFGKSKLPQRIAKLGAQSLSALGVRAPPRESIFLDRKLAGIFVMLSTLQVRLDARAILNDYLPLEGGDQDKDSPLLT